MLSNKKCLEQYVTKHKNKYCVNIKIQPLLNLVLAYYSLSFDLCILAAT